MRREGKESKIGGKMGTKWGSRDEGKMGISLQLVVVNSPCSEGWEGPDVCFQPSLDNAKRAAQTWLLGELHVPSAFFRGNWSHLDPEEKGASSTK